MLNGFLRLGEVQVHGHYGFPVRQHGRDCEAHRSGIRVLVRLRDVDLAGIFHRAHIPNALRRVIVGRGFKAGDDVPVAARDIDIHKAVIRQETLPARLKKTRNLIPARIGVHKLFGGDGDAQNVRLSGGNGILKVAANHVKLDVSDFVGLGGGLTENQSDIHKNDRKESEDNRHGDADPELFAHAARGRVRAAFQQSHKAQKGNRVEKQFHRNGPNRLNRHARHGDGYQNQRGRAARFRDCAIETDKIQQADYRINRANGVQRQKTGASAINQIFIDVKA